MYSYISFCCCDVLMHLIYSIDVWMYCRGFGLVASCVRSLRTQWAHTSRARASLDARASTLDRLERRSRRTTFGLIVKLVLCRIAYQ